jgi:hypothetical protein
MAHQNLQLPFLGELSNNRLNFFVRFFYLRNQLFVSVTPNAS